MMTIDVLAFDEPYDITRVDFVMGYGGWDAMSTVFAGGAGIVYAVEAATGNLLRYTGALDHGLGYPPDVIGFGGWNALTCLCSGGNGIIYAIEPATGDLLRYVNAHVAGPGQVANPVRVGLGGWNAFRILFCGGGGTLYAVETDTGNLLRYSSADTAGVGEVSNPVVVGRGGWNAFKFLFSGGGGVIFGVESDTGSLVRYDQADVAGDGQVANPVTLNEGGRDSFTSILADAGRILAVGAGPSDPAQTLHTRTVPISSIFDRVEAGPPVTVYYYHIDQFFGFHGIVNTVQIRDIEGSSNGALLRVHIHDKELEMWDAPPTAKFRGRDASVWSRVESEYWLYDSNHSLRANLVVTYWA